MKIYVYKNGMCDQRAGLGGVKHYSKAEEVDAFLKNLCANLSPFGHSQIRVFIANDEVEQHEVDHHMLMGDNYGLDLRRTSIKEVDTIEVAAPYNPKAKALKEARSKRIQMERELKI